jgi:hypothetical protein
LMSDTTIFDINTTLMIILKCVIFKKKIISIDMSVSCPIVLSSVFRLHYEENKLDIIVAFFNKLVEDVINFHLPY